MASERNEVSDGWGLWVVVWPILTTLLGSGLTYWILQQQRQTDLSLRPPVAVMEMSEWVRLAGSGETNQERFKDGSVKAELAAKKLQEQGVLVLDSRMVRGAPEQVYVTTPSAEKAREASH
jgi:hypothetical protein